MVAATSYLIAIGTLVVADCVSVRSLGPGSAHVFKLCSCVVSVVTIYLCSRHFDFNNSATLTWLRFCYVLVQVFLALLYSSVSLRIQQRDDTRILRYVDPSKPDDIITTTVVAYDTAKLSSARKHQFWHAAAHGSLHYFFGFTMPLLVGTYASLLAIFNDELLEIYVHNRPLCPRLVRPWFEPAYGSSIVGEGDGDLRSITWEKLWSYTKPTIADISVEPALSSCRDQRDWTDNSTRPGPTPWQRTTEQKSYSARSSASSQSDSDSVFSRPSPASTSTSTSSVLSFQPTPRIQKPGFFDQLGTDKYREWIQSLPPYELQKEHRRARVTKYGQGFGIGAHAVTAPATTVATGGLSTAAHGGAMLYHRGKLTLNQIQQKACEEEMEKRGIGDIDWRVKDVAKIAVSVVPLLEKFFDL